MTREIARQARLTQDVAQTQISVSTGKRLQRASDDPLAASRVATLRTAQANGAAWLVNVNVGRSVTAQADGVLKTASDLVARAREIGLAGANQPLAAADRQAIAAELGALAAEMDGLAASRSHLGQPLFADGAPAVMRFDSDTLFAAVPGRAAVFDSGGQSAAQHMRSAAIAIAGGDPTVIGGALAGLDGSVDQLATARAQIGLNAARLDRLADRHAERGIAQAADRSALEDTDLPSAIARLNAQTITLEAAQAAFARINRRNLFDILR